MKRIQIHWTAGAHKANSVDRKSYHRLIEGDGNIVIGDHPISSNVPPLRRNEYAAHTWSANSYAIGVAMCGMRGAVERPFNPGPSPLLQDQVSAMVYLVADLAQEYDIDITRETVLTHAEVQRTLGIKQRSKWDVMWLPGMDAPGDPIEVGDELRARIRAAMGSRRPSPLVGIRSAPLVPPSVPFWHRWFR